MEFTEREWEIIRDALEFYSTAGGKLTGLPDNEVTHANRARARDLWFRFSFEYDHG